MIRHALFAGVLNYEKLITPRISGASFAGVRLYAFVM